MKTILTVLSLVFLISMNLNAQFKTSVVPIPDIDYNPKKYVCNYASSEIIIDGKMNEEAWMEASATDFFVDIEGSKKPKPYYDTYVKMLWDSNYFYVAAELSEPHIWAKLKQRDTVIFYDNDFEIFIDPDGDTHNYFEFEINAFSTLWDLLLIKPYRDHEKVAVNSWDVKGIKTAVHINGTLNNADDIDSSWTVEIAIPWNAFSELSYSDSPPAAGDIWKINFSRVQWETEIINGEYIKKINPETGRPYPEFNWVWSLQGIINMHYPEMWGLVQFSEMDVGTFTPNRIDEYKWYLRQIYYAQKIYYNLNEKYADTIDKLKLPSLENFDWNSVEIKSAENLYSAKLEVGGIKLEIYFDGLVTVKYKKEIEKND
ncbi:MAG: carbohydrate-binding family 9-like protein [Melioribacteraceae bacterium]|nr:carbohydrate-binding family 9-like protein [Melioribacteraceae bacterium]MCF8356336.1 carbohydrate-binding family 9-like protein [Melioribacteraceae bacterium]MCF8395745.1 carbohydrate-binding family 9-like protein [Melioribacteraceae bacterium]MCF8420547.1 carbohydrate-binding family 9-like protein [Melioribacteraceae bacterium]